MKLVDFSVTNFRSVTTAHKIPMQNGNTTCKGLLSRFHKLERLGDSEPIGTRCSTLVDLHFDVGEQFWCILHLVDHNRRRVNLQEHSGITFCKSTFLQIIQCYILSISVHKLLNANDGIEIHFKCGAVMEHEHE